MLRQSFIFICLYLITSCGCAVEPQSVSYPIASDSLLAEQDGIKYLYADFVFPFNSAELTEHAKQFLDDMGKAIVENQERVIRIYLVGHTDSIGDPNYNLQLSKQRAQVSRDYLHKLGVSADLLHIQGVGEAIPFASNDIYEGRERNRRVEITLAIH